MRTKIVPLQIKTVPTDGSGEFTGLASTFGGEPDFQGDVVEYGAFAESIIRWKQLGDFPPVGLNHDYNTASSRIGKLTSMLEIPEGLLVSGQLHLKSEAAMAAYEAMLTGALDALSIGYGVIEQHKRADGVNVLTRLWCLAGLLPEVMESEQECRCPARGPWARRVEHPHGLA